MVHYRFEYSLKTTQQKVCFHPSLYRLILQNFIALCQALLYTCFHSVHKVRAWWGGHICPSAWILRWLTASNGPFSHCTVKYRFLMMKGFNWLIPFSPKATHEFRLNLCMRCELKFLFRRLIRIGGLHPLFLQKSHLTIHQMFKHRMRST
jgi:hypothetical protein